MCIRDRCDTILAGRKAGLSKHDILVKLAQIPGVYVPSLYDVSYFPDGRVQKVEPRCGAPAVVTKAILPDMNAQPLPRNFVVPMIGAVHDRAQIEVLRGCVRGCRFCQAGFLYRPCLLYTSVLAVLLAERKNKKGQANGGA